MQFFSGCGFVATIGNLGDLTTGPQHLYHLEFGLLPASSIYQRQAVLVPREGRQVGKSRAVFRLSLMLLHARSILVGIFSLLLVLARIARVYA